MHPFDPNCPKPDQLEVASATPETVGIPRDAVGVRHPPAPHARIVSLVPSLTELLFDLGLGASLVGRTAYCVHPVPAVRKIPAIGGTKRANLKKLLARAPTHALVNVDETPKALADCLADAGVSVVVTHPIAVDDNLEIYRLLGSIFCREAEAAALGDRFRKRRRSLGERAQFLPERRVLYLIWKRPWMTISADTYVSNMLAGELQDVANAMGSLRQSYRVSGLSAGTHG